MPKSIARNNTVVILTVIIIVKVMFAVILLISLLLGEGYQTHVRVCARARAESEHNSIMY